MHRHDHQYQLNSQDFATYLKVSLPLDNILQLSVLHRLAMSQHRCFSKTLNTLLLYPGHWPPLRSADNTTHHLCAIHYPLQLLSHADNTGSLPSSSVNRWTLTSPKPC